MLGRWGYNSLENKYINIPAVLTSFRSPDPINSIGKEDESHVYVMLITHFISRILWFRAVSSFFIQNLFYTANVHAAHSRQDIITHTL